MQATHPLIHAAVYLKRSGVVSPWKMLGFAWVRQGLSDHTKDVISPSFIGLQLLTSCSSSIEVQWISFDAVSSRILWYESIAQCLLWIDTVSWNLRESEKRCLPRSVGSEISNPSLNRVFFFYFCIWLLFDHRLQCILLGCSMTDRL